MYEDKEVEGRETEIFALNFFIEEIHAHGENDCPVYLPRVCCDTLTRRGHFIVLEEGSVSGVGLMAISWIGRCSYGKY